jgi:hypothetical protein
MRTAGENSSRDLLWQVGIQGSFDFAVKFARELYGSAQDDKLFESSASPLVVNRELVTRIGGKQLGHFPQSFRQLRRC